MILAPDQLMGGLILTFGVIPQIIKVIKTKSAKELTMLAVIMCIEMYAIGLLMDGIVPFFITNTASLLLQLTIAFILVKNKFFMKKETEEIRLSLHQKMIYRGRTIIELISSPIESWDQPK